MTLVFSKNLKLLCQFDIIMSSGQKTELKQMGKNTKIIENIGKLATTPRICKPQSAQVFKLHFPPCFTALKISLCSFSTPFTVLRMGELLAAIPSAVRFRNSPLSASFSPSLTPVHSAANCSPFPASGNLPSSNLAVADFTEFSLLPKHSLISHPSSFHSSGFGLRNLYTFVNLQTLRFFRLSWQVGNEIQ